MEGAAGPARSLQDELTCPVCLEYLRDPVMVSDCGHNFCRACVTKCWEESERSLCCPQCREPAPAGPGVCERHGEALKLFCQEDQKPVCLVCHLSWDHRAHRVVPIEEAARGCKVGEGAGASVLELGVCPHPRLEAVSILCSPGSQPFPFRGPLQHATKTPAQQPYCSRGCWKPSQRRHACPATPLIASSLWFLLRALPPPFPHLDEELVIWPDSRSPPSPGLGFWGKVRASGLS
uniref:RING-type domain-containing protein n=1 Tax=Gopherus agassizii TaxID=38772 RepID=A0A452HZC4_9SAUR